MDKNHKEIIVNNEIFKIIEQNKHFYAYKQFKYTLLTMPNFPVADASTLELLKKKLEHKEKLNQFLWII